MRTAFYLARVFPTREAADLFIATEGFESGCAESIQVAGRPRRDSEGNEGNILIAATRWPSKFAAAPLAHLDRLGVSQVF